MKVARTVLREAGNAISLLDLENTVTNALVVRLNYYSAETSPYRLTIARTDIEARWKKNDCENNTAKSELAPVITINGLLIFFLS